MLSQISAFGAFTIMLLVMFIGEIISKVTKGKFPTALVVTLLLCAGFWTILPADLVARMGITVPLFQLSAGILIVNLGTLISRREMASQWRTILISLMGLVSIILICLTLGATLFGWTNSVAATPPLCGAAIATAMVREAAGAIGNQKAVLVAIVCMTVQCLLGYPLGALCLGKEAKRLSILYKKGELKAPEKVEAAQKTDGKGVKVTTTMTLLKMSLITVISYYLQILTKGYVSMFVWCLIFGFTAHELKFLADDELSKANCNGLMLMILLIFLFGGLSDSTPETIFPVFGIAIGLVVISAAAMALMGLLAGRIFKMTFPMSYVIILNAFFGFPVNVMLTNEALDNNTTEPDERAAVNAYLMPKMMIGSFTSVTVVSVLVAGILIRFL